MNIISAALKKNCWCLKKKLELYLRIIFILNVFLLLVMAPFAYFFPKEFEGTSQANLFLIIIGSIGLASWFTRLLAFFDRCEEPIVMVQLIYKSLYAIYFAVVWNNYKFGPYGIIFCFFLPWILVIGVYLTLRVITIMKKNITFTLIKKQRKDLKIETLRHS